MSKFDTCSKYSKYLSPHSLPTLTVWGFRGLGWGVGGGLGCFDTSNPFLNASILLVTTILDPSTLLAQGPMGPQAQPLPAAPLPPPRRPNHEPVRAHTALGFYGPCPVGPMGHKGPWDRESLFCLFRGLPHFWMLLLQQDATMRPVYYFRPQI